MYDEAYYKKVEDAMKPVQDALRPVLIVGNSREPPSQKRGHKCCAGCCDSRRAVIIVNSINACMIIVNLLSLFIFQHNYNDPTAYGGGSTGRLIRTMHIVRFLVCCIGIVGSLYYKVYMIGLAAMMYVLDALMSILGFHLIHVVVASLFAYPHFFLMQEIKDDIMTPENYPNEEHSCCCV